MKPLRACLRCLLGLVLVCHACLAAAAPPLVLPDGVLGAPGQLPPNLLLNLSLTFEDAGAAYRGEYAQGADYPGYFNSRLCYRYPARARSRSVREPDLDERQGYFSPVGPADAQHGCGGDAFSGHLLNWATASTLDLVRLGLTGGDRVIDEPGITVLQRAWLPDGAAHPDFYAHPRHFPRKKLAAAHSAALTPFGSADLFIVSCRNRVLFSGTGKGSNCDAPRYGASGTRLVSDKFHGEFLARVRVCGADDSASRPGLCRPYGAAFKPEGALQRHAGTARIGLMAYPAATREKGAAHDGAAHDGAAHDGAAHDGAAVDGGVLRAPLKFIGEKAIEAPRYESQVNQRAEWSASSGVLVPNPDRSSGAASGTIAAVNLAGRSHPATAGSYAASDPGAELYYEALRYLQGREPGTGAVPGDGLPGWSSRADPVSAACQRNVIATIGHSSFIDDRHVPGNTRTGRNDAVRAVDTFAPVRFDVMQATRRVGDMEADRNGAFGNGAPRPDLDRLDLRSNGPDGAGSLYLAGAAYWAHTNPIRRDKPVTVSSIALELGAESDKGASALYLAAKYGAFNDRNDDGNPFITTGNRHDNTEWSADGSTPAGFFGATDAQAIGPAIDALFAAARNASGMRPGAVAASPVSKGRGFIVQAGHDLASGSGSLQRRALAIGNGGEPAIAPVPDWDASDLLSGNASAVPPLPALVAAARKIYTLDYRPDKTVTIAFDWASLPQESRALLDVPVAGGVADGLGEARTAFLRGERGMEAGRPGGVFRRRTGVLGDIVHSVPLLVGPPPPARSDPAYADFYRRHHARRSVAYVGANDGMLHAFDTASGAELFAYVPNALLPALPLLASPGYGHRPYVDASAGSGEALVDGRWRTILASGMGMGARGVFALDISDPAAFHAGLGALWEFTERDDPAMGHVAAPPLVARFRTAVREGVPQYRDFVVVASGINNGSDDGDGALFLLAPDKPAAQRWRRGVNYYRFDAPASVPSLANALAPPALAMAGDASVRHAYAGDLQGRLWRFDFSGPAPWGSAVSPLFDARDAGGRRQPVAHAPRIVFAPGGGYLVLFGTGKFLEVADTQRGSYLPQSFYAVHDGAGRPQPPLSRARLVPRTLTGTARYAVTGAHAELGGPEAPDAPRGWFFDFPQTALDGERVAGSPVSRAGTLIVDTLLPGADLCTAPASRSYVIDALSGFAIGADGLARSGESTGERHAALAGVAPMMIAMSASTGVRTATGRAEAAHTYAIVHPQEDGKAAPAQQVIVRFPSRRLGWREIPNWQDLHDASKKK
ncbi:pilus assembly protein [Massilia scottii]|uniref:pilus assembly protein n=1 Tax=Massilia scottii TaxID=3057166 RepID=UPI002796DB19|nr:PilC/PilY family type IV pilus protein [Massilia sp. CCM 9029]MDQ1831902.1 PilC/PilY family type IV pilus protein [Massilia sp. CCM 9029]